MGPIKTVAVSGGFDPLHIGHVRMFQEARKLGDRLVVILNNDNWLMDKKGFVFMPEQERKEIIEAYEFVDEVVLTSHTPGCTDHSVAMEIQTIKPQVFANGGDRKAEVDIPEAKTCAEIGCEMVFNVGGDKIQSSSWLTNKRQKYEERPWGSMEMLKSAHNWWIKTLSLSPNEQISLQKHDQRSEIWVCIDGTGIADVGGTKHQLQRGSMVWFGTGVIHQLTAGANGITIVEVAHGEVMSETDIKRYEDKYGRI